MARPVRTGGPRPPRAAPRGVAAACLLALALPAASAPGEAAAPAAAALSGERLRQAERIYRQGILPSGRPLVARRGTLELSGPDAACVQCHRRSGMGTVEGGTIVPPVAGRFLFEPRARTLSDMAGGATRGPDLAHARGRDRTRQPYTRETLLAAIREGRVPAGGELDPLMPRYALDEADAGLLAEYLGQLSTGWSPGVSGDAIHLATVVAPGVEPDRKRALLDELRAFVDVRNAGLRLERERDRAYPATDAKRYRRWELHAWELAGPPETWTRQLEALYAAQPVFALLSGTAPGTWEPVERFCESGEIPCWFPSVDLPPAAPGHYTTYFSGGVPLEARVLARRLLDGPRPRRVLQLREGDEVAAAGARELRDALAGSGLALEESVIPGDGAAGALRRALAGTEKDDAVVLWVRDGSVAALRDVPVPPGGAFFSALLLRGGESRLPPGWKEGARIVYPLELPERRRARTTRFRAWLAQRGLPLVDERLQGDAYAACLLMSEKVDRMLESLRRDYLLDLAEEILSEKLSTVIYHRLSLGPGQRVASKGAFIARFPSAGGDVVSDSGWVVP